MLFDCRSLLILSDLHLGARTFADTEARLLRLLAATSAQTDAMIINGDLFDFWFGWRGVMPPAGRVVLPALAEAARTRPVLLMGGNHDRWGSGEWATSLGLLWAPWEAMLRVAGHSVLCLHGDGLGGEPPRARAKHALVRSAAVQQLVGVLPPTLVYGLVRRFGPTLDRASREPAQLEQEAAWQEAGIRALLPARPAVDWLLVGHTHRPGTGRLAHGTRWLNSGAFAFDGTYAILNERGAELHRQG